MRCLKRSARVPSENAIALPDEKSPQKKTLGEMFARPECHKAYLRSRESRRLSRSQIAFPKALQLSHPKASLRMLSYEIWESSVAALEAPEKPISMTGASMMLAPPSSEAESGVVTSNVTLYPKLPLLMVAPVCSPPYMK